MQTLTFREQIEFINSRIDASFEWVEKTVQECYDSLAILLNEPNDDALQEIRSICTACRKKTSTANNPSSVYDEMINCSNLLEMFASLLKEEWDAYPDLQIEIAWILTNIASGNSSQTTAVMNTENVVPQMVRLLKKSTNREVIAQCVWCIGNICAESDGFRDIVCVENDCLDKLIEIVDGAITVENYVPNKSEVVEGDKIVALTSNLELVRVGTSTLSCVCKKEPSVNIIRKVIPVVSRIIKLCHENQTADDILVDALWCVAYCTNDSVVERIDAILEHRELIDLIIESIKREDNKIAVSALRTIGNIAGSTDDHTAYIARNTKALETFHLLLMSDRATDANIKEICWTVSNIAANSVPNTQRIIDSGIAPDIMKFVSLDVSFSILKEAVWATANSVCIATRKQLKYFVNKTAVIPTLVHLLSKAQDDIHLTLISLTLESLEAILAQSDISNQYDRIIKDLFNINDSMSKLAHWKLSNNVTIKKMDATLLKNLVHQGAYIDCIFIFDNK